MSRPPIPRHEPEIVAAEAKSRWHGDDEKVATTSLQGYAVHGVPLSSRYQKAHEYEAMAAMVEQLAASLRPLVRSVFCDSKAGASYAVYLNPCRDEVAYEIGYQMQHACFEADGGHNGIYLDRDAGETVVVGPDWSEFKGKD